MKHTKNTIYSWDFWWLLSFIILMGVLFIISLKKHYKMQEKAYYIKELKVTIFASSEKEFQLKKEKILSRGQRHLTGGKSASKITTLNCDGFTFKTTSK